MLLNVLKKTFLNLDFEDDDLSDAPIGGDGGPNVI